jgi:LPS sulfotransferase NodH
VTLEGLDTGYEGKFDFAPYPGPPQVAYLLASVPRSGSSWFSHILWQTGCLGAPIEYLNFEPASPYGFAATSPEAQLQLWRSALARRTSPNGVFGLKGFQMQLQVLQHTNPPLLGEVLATLLPRGRPKRIVYLARRDRAAHVVSLARATLSGIWRKEQERMQGAPRPLEYSQENLDAAERGIVLQETRWEQMFQDLRVEPLRLWFEDAMADPAEAARRVADYLGARIDPAAAVQVPQVEKQSVGEAPVWIEKYARSRGTGEGGPVRPE